MSVYRFNALLLTGYELTMPVPIYDEYDNLIGGASSYELNIVKCFVARSGYPSALSLTSGSGVWVTFVPDSNFHVSKVIISDRRLTDYSVYSTANNEENDDEEN